MDGDRPGELPDFLSERNGNRVLEADNREVSLMRVFEHYEVRSLDADEVSDLLGLEESDVRKGISYWRSDKDVYSELEDRVENFSRRDLIENAADYVQEREGSDNRRESEDLSQEGVDSPLEAAESAFSEIIERPGTALTPEDIEDDPDEKYLATNADEMHIEWERNDTELAVYTGWSKDVGPETGFTAFSVGGDQGKTLYVDRDEMKETVQEMYRNAVFGST